MPALEDDLQTYLRSLDLSHRRRSTQPLGGSDRAHPTAESRDLLAFCSNDYLGLAAHPALARAAAEGASVYGFGSGASRLVSGESPLHLALEEDLAAFVGQPAALIFATGYQTNLGVLTALAGRDDLIVSDVANHASIIDGCRLSRARIAVFKHCDPEDARRALGTPGDFRRRLLVVESLFSMDGDRAPLAELASLAAAHEAAFIVDEAHALGVVGPSGGGLCALAGVRPTVTIGTLGKALGTAGGFAATSQTIRDVLVNTARTFIYSTAPPAPVAAASLAALRLLRGDAGDTLRRSAYANALNLRTRLAPAGLALAGHDLIAPLRIGSDHRALQAAAALATEGILLPAIRPPTVPEGTARLRITLSAAHTSDDVARLADSLIRILGRRSP